MNSHAPRIYRRLFAIAVASLAVSGRATASDRFWSGSGSNDWFYFGNWQALSVPATTDSIRLPSSLAGFNVPRLDVNLTGSTSASFMNVDLLQYASQQATGYKLYSTNGSVLTLAQGLTVSSFTDIPGRFRINGAGLMMSGAGILNNGTELTVENGGSLTTSGELNVGIIAKVNATGGRISAHTLTLRDESSTTIGAGGRVVAGTLTASRDPNSGWGKPSIIINSGGTLELGGFVDHNITDGTLTFNSGGALVMPDALLRFSGSDAKATFNTNYGLRDRCVLSLEAGADLQSTSYLDVGNQSIATLNVQGAGTTVSVTGSTYTDWGVGSGAQAYVVLQSGAVGNYNDLHVGTDNAFARAQLLVGSALTTANLTMGGGTVTRQASLEVNQNSTFTVNGAATFNNQADLNLVSGAVNFNGDATFNAGSRLDRTGGTLNIASGKTLTFNDAVYEDTVSAGHKLPTGAKVTISGVSARFNVAAYLDIGNGALLVDSFGRYTSPTTAVYTDWGPLSNEACNVTVRNNARLNIGAVHVASAGAATVNVQSSGQVITGDLQFGGSATSLANVTLNDGILNTVGTVTAGRGTTITLDDPVGVSFTFMVASGALTMNDNARITTTGEAPQMAFSGLTMNGTSRIELNKLSELDINYTGSAPLPTMRGYLKDGLGTGNWAGTHLISLAFASDNRLGLGYFDDSLNQFVAVRHVLKGDANGDATVNFADLVILAQNYNGTNKFWTNGDFDYDGAVGFTDLVSLAQNYNQAALALPEGASADFAADWALAQSMVPEPTTLATLSMVFGGTMIRRRR